MVWTVRISESAFKELSALGTTEQKTIINYLKNRIENSEDPRVFAKPLKHTQSLWRYRVSKYRVICSIENAICTVLVLKIGKRDKVYSGI